MGPRMPDSYLRWKIGALLQLSALLEWLNRRTFLCIDRTSEELVKRRWERTHNATRRR